MAADPVRRLATYDDVLGAPEGVIAELIEGTLHTQPRPARRHAIAASVLGDELGPPFRRGRGGPGGWIFVDEPELHLGANVLVPDLAGWRKERIGTLAAEPAWFDLAPDWIAEVLSPSTAAKDRVLKMPAYAAAGVSYAWVVDPLLKTLEVFEREGTRWVLAGAFEGTDRARAVPFDAIELELGLLWDAFEP